MYIKLWILKGLERLYGMGLMPPMDSTTEHQTTERLTTEWLTTEQLTTEHLTTSNWTTNDWTTKTKQLND